MSRLPYLLGTVVCALAALVAHADGARADALAEFVADKAAVITLMHNKAKTAVIRATHDSFIRNFLDTSGEQVRRRLKPSIDTQLLGIQAGLTVDEICLISHDGREYARVVQGKIAADLSDDQAEAIFFDPTWEMGKYEAYLSPIYRSPDTDEWVFSFSAPIGEGGNAPALLHLEQNLHRVLYFIAMRPAPAGMHWYVLADDRRVIFDSAEDVESTAERSASHDLSAAFPRFAIAGLNVLELLDDAQANAPTVVTESGKRTRVAVAAAGRWAVVAVENSR